MPGSTGGGLTEPVFAGVGGALLGVPLAATAPPVVPATAAAAARVINTRVLIGLLLSIGYLGSSERPMTPA
jgi:hypothetical protein